MNKSIAVCTVAILQLAFLAPPAAGDCRVARPSDAIYAGVGRMPSVTSRSTPAQNDSRSEFVGLMDPNRGTPYDPAKSSFGSRYGENYGGPGSINDQTSTFLGTPCGPPMTVAPSTPPVGLPQAAPTVVAPAGTVDA